MDKKHILYESFSKVDIFNTQKFKKRYFCLRKIFLLNAREIHDASSMFFNYFRWKRVTEQLHFKHCFESSGRSDMLFHRFYK